MTELLGEYECKIDSKGRLRLPSALLKQLHGFGSTDCVVNRGLQTHLTLYPRSVWSVESAKVNKLNPYIKRNIQFKRYFYRGATEVSPDSADRILIPKSLIDYAGISKTVILQGLNSNVEIWSKEAYLKAIEDEPDDFTEIAQQTWENVPDIAAGPENIEPGNVVS